MPRTFEPITADQLKTMIEDKAAPYCDKYDRESFRGKVLALVCADAQIKKDLKVNVDFENFVCDCEEGYNGCEELTGLYVTKQGLAFLGCCTGGDWQVPVFFIIYCDGKKLRAYVPTDGNTWNTDTKTAYGDDPKADFENAKKRYPDIADGLDEWAAKHSLRWKELGLPEDYFEFDASGKIPKCDKNAILADIEERIQPKGDGRGSFEMSSPADGFKVTRVGDFIFLQPTMQGDVTGHGLMMDRQMAVKVAKEIVELL